MKTNLKTFPFGGENYNSYERWAKDFEAELREVETQYLRAYPLLNKVDKEVVFIIKNLFEEILGEAEK